MEQAHKMKPPMLLGEGVLRGPDGNAFVIIGRGRYLIRECGLGEEAAAAFTEDAFSAPSYRELLEVVDRWFSVLELSHHGGLRIGKAVDMFDRINDGGGDAVEEVVVARRYGRRGRGTARDAQGG